MTGVKLKPVVTHQHSFGDGSFDLCDPTGPVGDVAPDAGLDG
jgi:hypothetical protein